MAVTVVIFVLLVGSGIVGWWPAEDSGKDLIDSNDATLSGGATYAVGMVGKAFSLPDNNSSIRLPSIVVNGKGDLTFSAWLKTTDPVGAVISGANENESNEYLLFIPAKNQIEAYVKGKKHKVPVPNLHNGKFHHIAWVRSESGASQIFVDGVLRGVGRLPGGRLIVDPKGLWLGQEQDIVGGGFDTDQALIGSIDEVEIYDRALVESEVRDIFQKESAAGQALADAVDSALEEAESETTSNVVTSRSTSLASVKSGLVGRWTGDAHAKDSISRNHAQRIPTGIAGGNATFASGRIDRAFALDRSAVLKINDSPVLYSRAGMTMSVWVNVNSLDQKRQTVLWKGDAPDCSRGCREHAIFVTNDGKVEYVTTSFARRTRSIKSDAEIVRAGTWHHIAAVVDPNSEKVNLYVDGRSVASGRTDSSGVRDTTGPWLLGGIEVNGPAYRDLLAGRIDEFRIYSRPLQSSEISRLFARSD